MVITYTIIKVLSLTKGGTLTTKRPLEFIKVLNYHIILAYIGFIIDYIAVKYGLQIFCH